MLVLDNVNTFTETIIDYSAASSYSVFSVSSASFLGTVHQLSSTHVIFIYIENSIPLSPTVSFKTYTITGGLSSSGIINSLPIS